MHRELPPRPHLDHLKKQAKDLVDAHRCGDPEALQRIGESLPACAGRSREEIARMPFALHDAQSTLAREYGFRSWHDLRVAVAERSSGGAFPRELLLRFMGQAPPEAVTAALRLAWGERGRTALALGDELPATLPVLAVRNALMVPGALLPLHVARPASLAALAAARRATPPLLAVFTQRAAETEQVSMESLYPVGCLAVVASVLPYPTGAFVVLEGLRWISLLALTPAGNGGQASGQITPLSIKTDSDTATILALTECLRMQSRKLARTLPDAEQTLALLDTIEEPERLVDLLLTMLRSPVAEKVLCAAQPRLEERMRLVGALVDAELADTAR